MPPVMGAAAFIMAEFLQVSYGAVCVAAAIPAVLYYACLFIHVDLDAAKQRIGAAADQGRARALRGAQIGLALPGADRLPGVRADLSRDLPAHARRRPRSSRPRILMVFALIFGYRGKRASIAADADGGDRDRPRLARHHPDRRRRRHHGRDHEHFRPRLQHDLAAAGAVRRQRVPAAAADRGARLRARHRPADGERLHPDRDLAGAGAGQARGDADGRAHVRHVQRHAVDDHAAGGVRRLCGRQHRAHRRLDHGLDRLPGRLEHVHPAVPVRADAEPADGRPGLSDRLELRAHPVRPVRRHGRRSWALRSRRCRCRCASSTALLALPIVLPPESFAGGYYVNFIGIAAGIALLAVDYLRRETAAKAKAAS